MLFLWILLGLLGLFLLYLLLILVCALLVDANREYDRHNPLYRLLMIQLTAITLWVMRIRTHVEGRELLPQGRVLFVSNHRSSFDPLVTWQAFPQWRISYISKPENFKIPVFGRIIRRCCFLPIDRENPRNAIRTIQAAAKLMAEDQVSVGVYPEGTRSKNCVLLPFHDGVFKIAQKANVPIAVVSVEGTEKIHKNHPLHRSHVYLTVLEVISAETVTTLKSHVLGEHIRTLLEQKLN